MSRDDWHLTIATIIAAAVVVALCFALTSDSVGSWLFDLPSWIVFALPVAYIIAVFVFAWLLNRRPLGPDELEHGLCEEARDRQREARRLARQAARERKPDGLIYRPGGGWKR